MKQISIFILALCSFFLSNAQGGLSENPIVAENELPGTPFSEWSVPNFRDNRIAGFGTKMSLNSGETVRFKINVQGGANFTLKIYRVGYYGGHGARLMCDLGTLAGTAQAAGISDPVTGLLDCGNWSESASWNIPVEAVSGLYVAKIERTGGGSNHIVFIVRNDASHSDLYLQFPDATWQAYNGYGGNSLYDGTVEGGRGDEGNALKVSYNRPLFPYNSLFNTEGRGADWYMNAEYPMIRWLERNGYDVTYTSCNDVANNGARLLNHKVFISVAHDEYWSKNMRDNVEAARSAGVNLAFFSGNEVYWKTRWEDTDGTEDRTLVCYKEGNLANGGWGERTCGFKCDPSPEWTGLWRTGADHDGGKPENALTGQISWTETPDATIQVPSYYKKLRFWRNTTIPSMGAGQVMPLGPRTLGYEWDYEQYAASYPHGRITMSSTTLNSLTHKLSLYRHASGALVFGAGTIQWSWGLDGDHYSAAPEPNTNMQQATVNLFADMGVQPATLQNDLIAAQASTDFTAPISTIITPSNGASFPAKSTVTISGTATDAAVVAGVEISLDGGVTWVSPTVSDLDGTVSWSYTWVPETEGTVNIKSRGFDDSGNMEIAGPGITVNILPASCPCTLFKESDVPDETNNNDGQAIELGVKFRSTKNGVITGMRFYKGTAATGTHVGHLWTNTGTMLAEATFVSETSSGWQQVIFNSPVPVTAGTTYIASYFSPSGYFAGTGSYFLQNITNGPLIGLADGEDGLNGLYKYTSFPTFPTGGYQASNYWVDVIFMNSNTLPVSLVYFSATAKEKAIGLRWTTASEFNNKGFEIQRSNNGVNWSAVGFVGGAGNSTSTINYSFDDENLSPGKYYYRLKQIDIDLRFVYSPIVSAVLGGKEFFSLEQNYPNPSKSETIIKFTLPRPAKVNLSLFDMNGRLVKVLLDGSKDSGTHAISLNASTLSTGLYYYKIQAGENSAVKKMIIQ